MVAVNFCINPNAPVDTIAKGYIDNKVLVNNISRIIAVPSGGFKFGGSKFNVGDYVILNDKNTRTIENPLFQSLTNSEYAKSNAHISEGSFKPTRLFQKFFERSNVGAQLQKIDPFTPMRIEDYFNCFAFASQIRACVKKKDIKNYLNG